ncbi:MAG: hypothetical protein PVG39_19440 [Desulfobacteraceae bacterium]|jgi:hypothetical protein
MHKPESDSYILIIKDEPYEVILKEEEGLVNKTIDEDLEIKERWYTINNKKIPEVNILWNVKEITPETAANLDTKEQIQLLKDYLYGQKTLNSVKNHPDSSIAHAKGDYDIAVSNIFTEQPDYDTSCQASLRFASQALKAKLKNKEKTFDDGEILTDLAEKLDDVIYKEIAEIIPWVQKSTGEGDIDASSTLEDAVNAVRSSIALFAKLFPDEKAEKQGRGFLNISS